MSAAASSVHLRLRDDAELGEDLLWPVHWTPHLRIESGLEKSDDPRLLFGRHLPAVGFQFTEQDPTGAAVHPVREPGRGPARVMRVIRQSDPQRFTGVLDQRIQLTLRHGRHDGSSHTVAPDSSVTSNASHSPSSTLASPNAPNVIRPGMSFESNARSTASSGESASTFTAVLTVFFR